MTSSYPPPSQPVSHRYRVVDGASHFDFTEVDDIRAKRHMQEKNLFGRLYRLPIANDASQVTTHTLVWER
jgi:hypothetical protein